MDNSDAMRPCPACGCTTFNAVTSVKTVISPVRCAGGKMVAYGAGARNQHRDERATGPECVCQNCGAPLLNLPNRLVLAEEVHTFHVSARIDSYDGETGVTINAAYWLADEDPAVLRLSAIAGWNDDRTMERLGAYVVYSAPNSVAAMADAEETIGWVSREEAIAWLYRYRPDVYALCVDEISFSLILDCEPIDVDLCELDDDDLFDVASDELAHWMSERSKEGAEPQGICFKFDQVKRCDNVATFVATVINDDLSDQRSLSLMKELMLLLAGATLNLPAGSIERPGERGRVLPFRRS